MIDHQKFSKEVVYNCKGSRMCIQDNSNTKLIIRQKNDILMVCTTTLKVDSCAMQYTMLIWRTISMHRVKKNKSHPAPEMLEMLMTNFEISIKIIQK